MAKIHNSTKDKILKLLLSDKEKEFTIRAVSKKVDVDYKTIHIFINQLIKDDVIKAKRAGQTVLCSINHKIFNSDVFRAEYLRRQDLLGNKNLYVLYKQLKDVKEPFFILLVFGSYASGKQTKGSDIDLMLITDNEKIKNKIEQILSLLPLKIHLLDFSPVEFLSMLGTTEFNVGKEAFKNSILLFGIEDYYRLMRNVGEEKDSGGIRDHWQEN